VRKITKIILHCSATREGRDHKMEEIRQWHLNKGWRDIGYNYVIELDGSIRKGRSKLISGAHTRGHNKESIGICYIGGVEATRNSKGGWTPKDTRTDAQKESLRDLLIHLSIKYPDATLHGHNEFAAKACPSFDVQKEYNWYNTYNKVEDNYRCSLNNNKHYGKI